MLDKRKIHVSKNVDVSKRSGKFCIATKLRYVKEICKRLLSG